MLCIIFVLFIFYKSGGRAKQEEEQNKRTKKTEWWSTTECLPLVTKQSVTKFREWALVRLASLLSEMWGRVTSAFASTSA